MKRTIFFLAFLLALAVQAERRSDAEMRSQAQQALAASQSSSRLKAKAANASLGVLADHSQLTLFGNEELGWAMISKDDTFSPILGYSDEPIDMTNPAPAFLWLMECFNQGMECDLQESTTTKAMARRKACSVLRPVSPLLKTNWDQFWPYNLQCPYVTKWSEKEGKYIESITLTGCVATALAQVLYYHKLPKKVHGKKTYIWYNKEENKRMPLSYDFAARPFQWNYILASYAGSPSQKNIDAIAELMYACGVIANMGYGTGGSGASVNQTIKSVNAYFEDVRGVDFGYHMDLEVIARELNAKRPVIFAGANDKGEGGHCFVIDGADEAGLLHCNMGWSGSGNGYYASDAMNGYPTFQQLAGIQPAENLTVSEPLAELQGYTITADVDHPATEIQPNTWYALWNCGRAVSLCDAGKGKTVTTEGCAPAGQLAPYVAGQLVRLTLNTSGTRYYVQTGLGNYIPSSFTHNKTAASSTAKGDGLSFTQMTDSAGTLHPDVFCVRTKDDVRLDCNGVDVVGWETGMTQDITGNAAWRLYPIKLTPASDMVSVSSVALGVDTLRMVVNGTYQISPTVLPANASVPQVIFGSTKPAIATVDDFGFVQAVATGTTTLSATAADGSAQKSRALLMVGNEKAPSALTSLRLRGVYTLRYFSGHKGILMATDTTTVYPQLRGIISGGNTVANKMYWEDAQIGASHTLWQVAESSEGDKYLFNIGLQRFLVPSENGEQFIFSSAPAPVYFSEAERYAEEGEKAKNVIHITTAPSDGRYLMANSTKINPAQSVDAAQVSPDLCRWQLCELTGISTGLHLLSVEELDAMLVPEGIVQPLSTLSSHLTTPHDLTGRPCVQQPKSGIYILNGKKIIR